MEYPELNFIFNCMDKKYYSGTIDNFSGDYEYQFYFSIGYKNNKFYFPYIHYHEFFTDKQEIYHNIDINYKNYEDIYEFINTLYNTFSKNFIYNTSVKFIKSVRPINWEKSIKEKKLCCMIELFDFKLENLKYYLNNIINTNLTTKSHGFDRSYYTIELEQINNTNKLNLYR